MNKAKEQKVNLLSLIFFLIGALPLYAHFQRHELTATGGSGLLKVGVTAFFVALTLELLYLYV